MLFVSFFPLLLSVAKVFLFEALHFTACHSLLSSERPARGNCIALSVPSLKIQHAALAMGSGMVNNFRQLPSFAQLSAERFQPGSLNDCIQPFADLCRDVHLESLKHLCFKNFG